MRFNHFAGKVQEHGYLWSIELFDKDSMQVFHTIGRASVRNTGVLLAVTKVVAKPLGDEGLRADWHISTANTVSTNEDFDRKSILPINLIQTDPLTRVPAGHSPWLPDDTQVIVSNERVFFPTLYIPNDGPGNAERYPLVIPEGAPADL